MRLLQNVVAGRLSSGNRIYHELSKPQTGAPLDAPTLRAFLQAVEEGQLAEDQKQILLVPSATASATPPNSKHLSKYCLEFLPAAKRLPSNKTRTPKPAWSTSAAQAARACHA